MTKKAEPIKKKRKTANRPERGPPKLRLPIGKLRQITAQAVVRKEAEELARKTREEQDAAAEADRKKSRDIERARKLLVQVGKIARAEADKGNTSANVYRLDRDDLDVTACTMAVSADPSAIIGPARHVYDALVDEGFVVTINGGVGPNHFINIRWL